MTNEWNLKPGSWKDSGSSLKQKFENFVMENPEWVVYVRKDPRFKCPYHWDEATRSPLFGDPTCAYCGGFGMKATFEIIPCRIERDRGTMGPMDGEKRSFPGYIEQDGIVCDMPRWVSPALEDLVFVCEWPVHPQRIAELPHVHPLSIQDVYLVKKTNPYFEREIVWTNCGLELYPIDSLKMRQILERTDQILVRNGRDKQWQQESYW
mgnify:CR=1 FL=1